MPYFGWFKLLQFAQSNTTEKLMFINLKVKIKICDRSLKLISL